MKYLISHQEQEAGPFTLEEIVAKVRAKELDLFDYIFDEPSQDWVLLMEHSELAQKLKSNKPPRPPQAEATAQAAAVEAKAAATPATPKEVKPAAQKPSEHAITEWFVLKGENKFGPFEYSEILKMLQQKIVYPFDFIWHTSMKDWTRVGQLAEFSEASIREFLAKDKKGVFSERKFNRVTFTGRVLVHDNHTVWQGTGFELSRGGVGLTMSNTMIIPGQQVYVHINGGTEIPSFNALCEVVAKQLPKENEPIQYGLKFIKISPEVQDEFYKKVA